ncbi:MAG: DUF4163 domain-containing protein [Gelidibacter sp.]|nr:DUF4163 domain-containing protein [Gelidibacter sp.]
MKKISFLICFSIVLLACNEDVKLTFEEQHVEQNDGAIVAINYPKAKDDNDIAVKINKHIEHFLANEINLGQDEVKGISLKDAIKNFNNEYKLFKHDFADTSQQWEVSIESEITYENEHLICVAVNSYLDTGGAHGNEHVSFLVFDKQTGNRLKPSDFIKDAEGFATLAEPYFKNETKPLTIDEDIEDYFFGEGFQLPENIGFSENGVILLYNVYEIASYTQGVTEFTIPYDKAKPFLKFY